MPRLPVGAALCLSLLAAASACGDPPVAPTQSPVVGGATSPGSTPPATTPSTPAPAPSDPLVQSPFIVDTGATPGGRLVFAYSNDFWEGPSQIQSVLPDGTGFTQLTPSTVKWAWSPAWSPDDALIAYVTFGTGGESLIRVIRPDGTGDRPLIAGDYPFWLADGRVGFACSSGICAVDATGANSTVLLQRTSITPDFGFTISPDGSMIAFVRFVENATHVYGPGDIHYTVWVMRRDGTGERRVTQTDAGAALEGSPTWSRDGRQIAFTSMELGVAVADVDGGRLHSVSHSGDIRPSIGSGSPAWSPDGTKVMFGGSGGIFFIANADGSGVIRRVRVPVPFGYDAVSLSWSNR